MEVQGACARRARLKYDPNLLGAALSMVLGNEKKNLDFGISPRSHGTDPQSEIYRLRQSLAASHQALATVQAEKYSIEARLRESEDLFRTRAIELARYQAELEAANDRLRNLAVTDDLTGLRNRRAFEERLAFEFSMARRKRRGLSVALIDADDFKRINDRLGHPAGDSVLQQLARVLQATTRLTDLAVRYGGEEFAVILSESSERNALHWCKRLRQALSDTAWEHHPVTVSMGVAGLTPECLNGSHLVAMADEALYRAKRNGKDCFVASGDPSDVQTERAG
jgi:diguanylate cyclase (GGDEF)-like protein